MTGIITLKVYKTLKSKTYKEISIKTLYFSVDINKPIFLEPNPTIIFFLDSDELVLEFGNKEGSEWLTTEIRRKS
jgi:hypothetical protein